MKLTQDYRFVGIEYPNQIERRGLSSSRRISVPLNQEVIKQMLTKWYGGTAHYDRDAKKIQYIHDYFSKHVAQADLATEWYVRWAGIHGDLEHPGSDSSLQKCLHLMEFYFTSYKTDKFKKMFKEISRREQGSTAKIGDLLSISPRILKAMYSRYDRGWLNDRSWLDDSPGKEVEPSDAAV